MDSAEPVEYREATVADVPAMAFCRARDADGASADSRMAAYFDGQHHPTQALPPRTGFIATSNDAVIGYIAGHETHRMDCQGEVQYLYVAPEYRRQGIATALLRLLAEWFHARGDSRICVNVNVDSPPAAPFYLSCGALPINQYWYMWPEIRVFLDA